VCCTEALRTQLCVIDSGCHWHWQWHSCTTIKVAPPISSFFRRCLFIAWQKQVAMSSKAASRIAPVAFKLKLPHTGVPPPPPGPPPPFWSGVRPLRVIRNAAFAGLGTTMVVWVWRKAIQPALDGGNSEKTSATASAPTSRIENLLQAPNTEPPVVQLSVAEGTPTVRDESPAPVFTASAEASVLPATPPEFVVRESPWWLEWLPTHQILEAFGLVPWPFDYGRGSSSRDQPGAPVQPQQEEHSAPPSP
jgi:hypothetical protein